MVITLVLCLCLSSSGMNVLANEITEAQDQKTNLEKKKTETESMLAELEKKKSDTLAYIQELDKKMAGIETEIARLNNEISTANAELEQTRIELEEAKITEANQYDSMKRRIQYMYMNGNDDYLQMLMESDSMSDFLNNSEYVKQISDYDRNMLSRYTAAKEEVIQKEATIETKIVELEELNAEVEYEKQTVEVLINDKNTELQKYNQSIDESEAAINSYVNEIQKQEQLIEDLLEAERKRIEEEERRRKEEEARKAAEAARKAAEAAEKAKAEADASAKAEDDSKKEQASKNEQTTSSSNVSSKGFRWPVPSSGRITCKFGYRDQPTAGASTNHKGIDIGATSGSDIVATKAGTVVTSSYGWASGYYVMIYHGDGVYSYYMHCSKLLVDAGDYVEQGDVIALIGSTGVSTGPHLHFAITINGEYVNPSNYVSY